MITRPPDIAERPNQCERNRIYHWFVDGRRRCVPSDTQFPGYTSLVGNYAEQNSVLADILESQGAVLYVKTNLPQTIMVCHYPLHEKRRIYTICSGQKHITIFLEEQPIP